jgi:hypothetical protein
MEALIMFWVARWFRIVGEYFSRPGYRCEMVEMFSLAYFLSRRFFLRSLNAPHFYFIYVERLLPQFFQFAILELLCSVDQLILLFVSNTI